jgi:hypothetical protein
VNYVSRATFNHHFLPCEFTCQADHIAFEDGSGRGFRLKDFNQALKGVHQGGVPVF